MEEKKRLGTIKENEVLVQRKKEILLNGQMQNVTVPFRIVDQPLKLKQNEWSVAFFMAVDPTQPAYVCPKLKIETLEQLWNIANGVVLMSLWLTLNIFHTSFKCYYYQLWTCNCRPFNDYCSCQIETSINWLFSLWGGHWSWTLSWRRSQSYKNQSVDLICKSVDWILYGRHLRHERDKS